MSRSGATLTLLLIGGYRSLVDAAQVELAARGYEDVRPVHDFAIRAIASGADNASELGRRLAVSKQAAAKTIGILEKRGYIVREVDPVDARRKRLCVTAHGFNMLREAEEIFDELRNTWARQIGIAQIEEIEKHLAKLVGTDPLRLDTSGWLAQDLGE
ncbi:MarR family winged helix-turn-helix transcriptional regulator [Dictyobacter aurantiacus]|uniref:MarR family transcriptional regulator n=1 Tax=Dictyobacter aurantiacus TaxID=1936993 RepID=A0A401ZLQ9_9CHLR|nr:MarR family transcriptional regulator [Dictyobacter aurantiacus]